MSYEELVSLFVEIEVNLGYTPQVISWLNLIEMGPSRKLVFYQWKVRTEMNAGDHLAFFSSGENEAWKICLLSGVKLNLVLIPFFPQTTFFTSSICSVDGFIQVFM